MDALDKKLQKVVHYVQKTPFLSIMSTPEGRGIQEVSGSIPLVTRKPQNSKAYNRKRTQEWKKELPDLRPFFDSYSKDIYAEIIKAISCIDLLNMCSS